MIRRRGKSFQVVVYAGVDPLTGRRLRLCESTTDEAEAQRILRRLTAQVDQQRHARTNAAFRTAMDPWLRTHEVEETTRAGYEQYARVHLYISRGSMRTPYSSSVPRPATSERPTRLSQRITGSPFVGTGHGGSPARRCGPAAADAGGPRGRRRPEHRRDAFLARLCGTPPDARDRGWCLAVR
jgi:hypothetical protein